MITKLMMRMVACVAVLVASAGQTQAGVITYNLSTVTGNTDGTTLDSGFFETDGTTGTGLTLGGILTDYSVTITEGTTTNTFTPSNSSILNDLVLFDITSSTIVNPGGPGRDRFTIRSDQLGGVGDGLYQTANFFGGSTLFVSAGNAGGSQFAFSGSVLIGTAVIAPVPEPTSLAIFGTICLVACGRRRKS